MKTVDYMVAYLLNLTSGCTFDIEIKRFLNSSHHGQYKVVAVISAKMHDQDKEDSILVLSLNSIIPEETYKALHDSIAQKLSLSKY